MKDAKKKLMSNFTKNFDISATSLNVLHNYSEGLTQLFSDLHLIKFLGTSAKPL
jgi:hypothetical protein